jgi:hypothetical protein
LRSMTDCTNLGVPNSVSMMGVSGMGGSMTGDEQVRGP